MARVGERGRDPPGRTAGSRGVRRDAEKHDVIELGDPPHAGVRPTLTQSTGNPPLAPATIEASTGNRSHRGTQRVSVNVPLTVAPTPRTTRRRPAGLRLTSRDHATLRWIADQDAVRADVIAHLLGRADPLTRNGARRVIDRWRHGGLVQQERLIGRGAPVCWLTNRGLRLVGTTYRARRPSLGRLEHLHAVSLVRLGIERRGGRSWTSERALQRPQDRPDAHLADGRFVAPSGAVTAVEVELTLKDSRRLRAIVDDLTIEYPAVLYVVRDRRVRRAVERAVDELAEHRRVAVVDLEPFLLDAAMR